jgi:hypothetical protein
MDEVEEVFDVVFSSGEDSAESLHPCEEPFHFPSPAISPKFATILSLVSTTAPVRGNHFDVVFVGKLLVERVRVVGFIADEPGGELIEEAAGKNVFHKLALGWRSAFDRYCERKTVISGDSDDFRAFSAAGGTNGIAPFLALAKVASTNLLPDSACLAHTVARPVVSAPLPTSRCAPTAGTGDGRSGRVDTSPATRAIAHPCPAPKAPRSAQPTCRATTATVVRRPGPAQNKLDDQPLFIGQLPASCHSTFAGSNRALKECTSFKSQRFMRLIGSVDILDTCVLKVARIGLSWSCSGSSH